MKKRVRMKSWETSSIVRLVREVCKNNKVEIMKGHLSHDHLHLFVSGPPHLVISRLVHYMKVKSSNKLIQENMQRSCVFWEKIFLARGFLK